MTLPFTAKVKKIKLSKNSSGQSEKNKLSKNSLGQPKYFIQPHLSSFTFDPLGDWRKGKSVFYLLVKMRHILQWKIFTFLTVSFIFSTRIKCYLCNQVSNKFN